MKILNRKFRDKSFYHQQKSTKRQRLEQRSHSTSNQSSNSTSDTSQSIFTDVVKKNSKLDLQDWICVNHKNKNIFEQILTSTQTYGTPCSVEFFVNFYNQLTLNSSNFNKYFHNQKNYYKNYTHSNFNNILKSYINSLDYEIDFDDVIEQLVYMEKIKKNETQNLQNLSQKKDFLNIKLNDPLFDDQTLQNNQVLQYIIFLFQYLQYDLNLVLSPNTFCRCFVDLFDLYKKKRFNIYHFFNFFNTFKHIQEKPKIIFEFFQLQQSTTSDKLYSVGIIPGNSDFIQIISCNCIQHTSSIFRQDFFSDTTGHYCRLPSDHDNDQYC